MYMPKVSFYLRNEDIEKWRSIEKKTEWVHDNLNDIKPLRAQTLNEQVATVKKIIDKPEDVKKYVEPVTVKYTNNWGA